MGSTWEEAHCGRDPRRIILGSPLYSTRLLLPPRGKTSYWKVDAARQSLRRASVEPPPSLRVGRIFVDGSLRRYHSVPSLWYGVNIEPFLVAASHYIILVWTEERVERNIDGGFSFVDDRQTKLISSWASVELGEGQGTGTQSATKFHIRSPIWWHAFLLAFSVSGFFSHTRHIFRSIVRKSAFSCDFPLQIACKLYAVVVVCSVTIGIAVSRSFEVWVYDVMLPFCSLCSEDRSSFFLFFFLSFPFCLWSARIFFLWIAVLLHWSVYEMY